MMLGKCSCLIAASALILMLALVFANAIYIKNTAEYILTLIYTSEDLGGSSVDSVLMISKYWDESMPVLKLSLSQKELDEISLNINEAIICAEKPDEEEYKKSMARLRRAIEGIKKREELSPENIF